MGEVKGDCVIFPGHKTRTGYGQKSVGGKLYYAHRLVLAEHLGVPIETLGGTEVRHRCDNPSCVNPLHLELGTHAENMQDMRERQRSARGERNGAAVLTAEQVDWVRKSYRARDKRYGGAALARLLGVSQQQISSIIRGVRWRGLEHTTGASSSG